MDFDILKSFIMPQSAPSDSYTPPDHYNVYANAFDLSLLPTSDGDVPHIPQPPHVLPQQSSNLTGATTSELNITIDDYIPTTVFQHFAVKTETICASSPQYFTSSAANGHDSSFFTIFPPSPTPSHYHESGATANTTVIKQEFSTLFPPSPPDSYGSLSPHHQHRHPTGASPAPSSVSATSSEVSDTECIDIDSLLLDATTADEHDQRFEPFLQQQDHQLLREFLQDTTFQRKHNLKPLALDALLMGGSWDTNGGCGGHGDCDDVDDIGSVISLALEHARKDVQRTCAALHISPDPQQWSIEQVQLWLVSTVSQFGLSIGQQQLAALFPEDGASLTRLSDDDFVKRLPQNGVTLHAQLEVWKAACCDSLSPNTPTAATCLSMLDMMDTMNDAVGSAYSTPIAMPWSPVDQRQQQQQEQERSASMPDDLSDDEDDDMSLPALAGISSAVAVGSAASSAAISGEPSLAASAAATATGKVAGATKVGRQGGAHIHLWQFLKELLADAQLHGTAIRWLDRPKGVFKIEDSVHVARLWGRRKNRPAMNYDKLSRSIRQYYKKGIMKKTERSQRLVYQFCHPYCL